jgi:hypothetical protein
MVRKSLLRSRLRQSRMGPTPPAEKRFRIEPAWKPADSIL